MHKLYLVDTTLRDGEQAPGVAFSLREKVAIARMLDLFGVDVIEAGTPAMGDIEQKAISVVSALGLRARVAAWNRMRLDDIRASLACGVKDLFLSAPVSDLMIKCKLGKSRDWVLKSARNAIGYARDFGCRVTVGAEDASRADRQFLLEFALSAREMGAERLRFADTVGVMDPFQTFEQLSRLGKILSPTELEFHGHNDFGMATANALAAFRAGVGYIDTTVGGLGERAGNTDLKKFIMAIGLTYGIPTGIRLNIAHRLERYVAAAAGRDFRA